MKTIILIAALLLLAIPAKAQDSTSVAGRKERSTMESDKSGNFSIDKKKKNDVFIDKDGDGICDFRAKGLSFEKFRKRNRQGPGDGKGKGKGNH